MASFGPGFANAGTPSAQEFAAITAVTTTGKTKLTQEKRADVRDIVMNGNVPLQNPVAYQALRTSTNVNPNLLGVPSSR